jgi:hypothetical protein
MIARAALNAVLLAAFLPPQAQEPFEKRVRSESGRVLVDDVVVCEGSWKAARVDVVDVGGRRAREIFGESPVWKQIVVTADGEERIRIPVPTTAKPIAWPPLKLEEVKPVLKRLTETQGGRKSLVVLLGGERGEFELYRGPVQETRVERTVQAFTVYLADDVLYRVVRGSRPAPGIADVLRGVNEHRLRAGIGLLRLQAGLTRGCDLHALYLAKNEPLGLSAHLEDPKATGYTEEGARAGKRSVISPFAPHETPLEAVESLMATLYHRVGLLHPALADTGIGWAYRRDGLGFLVMDVGGSDGKADPKVWPVVYPVNGQQEVPLDFALGSKEVPNPIPDDGREAGYPVTIQVPERKGRGFDGEARLFSGSTEVEAWVSTPDNPARADWPQPGVLCLIPKQKLKPKTTYTVRFSDRISGLSKEWSFTTRGSPEGSRPAGR